MRFLNDGDKWDWICRSTGERTYVERKGDLFYCARCQAAYDEIVVWSIVQAGLLDEDEGPSRGRIVRP
jgi:hypothetical protein